MARGRGRGARRAVGAGLLVCAALGLGAAPARPDARALGPLPPLPLPPSVPLPVGGHPYPESEPPPAPPPAPPRPSRSPPSRCAGTSAPGPVPFAKPVFPCDFSDPMVLKDGGAWYAYATDAGWEHGARAFPILRSYDLRHWRFVGDALRRPPRWTAGDLWGPSVVRWRGRYLLFYNARLRGRGRHCLAVASASRPAGPFRARRRLICQFRRLRGYIDPAPLIAPGGRLYLFFSVDSAKHSISALRLTSDGMHVATHPHRLLGVSRRWRRLRERTVEGPWPLRRNGRYYLFYSAGSWSADYRMAYAVSRHPLGPYRDTAPVPILKGRAKLPSPGGGSVVAGLAGTTWLAFHAWSGRPGYRFHSERTMRIAPLLWSRRGVPRVDLRGGA